MSEPEQLALAARLHEAARRLRISVALTRKWSDLDYRAEMQRRNAHLARLEKRLAPLTEGFLLGEGTVSVPDEYQEYKLILALLAIYTRRAKSCGAGVKLAVCRGGKPRNSERGSKQVQRRTVRAEKAMA